MRPGREVEYFKTTKPTDSPSKSAGKIRSDHNSSTLANHYFCPLQSKTSYYQSLKMQFISIVLLLVSATSGLIAGPSANLMAVQYVELYREKTSNGSLIYLGPPEGSKMVRKEVPRLEEHDFCKKKQSITCDSGHTARNNLCDELVTELFADPTISVGLSPRQICYLGDGDENNHCCVSWNKVVKNLNKGDLSTPANSIMQQCTQSGISGKMDNVVLHGVCATACLSNSGTGCA